MYKRIVQADSLPAEPQGKPTITGVGSLSLLQRIFQTQESNWGLLHGRWILYRPSYQGNLTHNQSTLLLLLQWPRSPWSVIPSSKSTTQVKIGKNTVYTRKPSTLRSSQKILQTKEFKPTENLWNNLKGILKIPLTHERHGFELCGFTYTGTFFKCTYYSTT